MGRLPDTLIVWTEPDGIDYALSFQDPEGCTEVWNFIQDVQKHLAASRSLHTPRFCAHLMPNEAQGLSSSPTIGPEPSSIIASTILRDGSLPKPALASIIELDKTMKAVARIPALKERCCEIIQNDVSYPLHIQCCT